MPRQKNTKAQEKTIAQIRNEYRVHSNYRGVMAVSFGTKDNRICAEIDSKGKIISAFPMVES